MGKVVNRREAAATLGVAQVTIDDWISQGMPVVAKPERKGGQWQIDLGAVLEWHRQRERQAALGDDGTVDKGQADARKAQAQACLAELELARERGQLVDVQDTGRVWDGLVTAFRARIRSVPPKLAPIVALLSDPVECESLLRSEVDQALAELSEHDPGELEPSSRPIAAKRKSQSLRKGRAAAAGPKAQRVGRQVPEDQPGIERGAGPVDNGQG